MYTRDCNAQFFQIFEVAESVDRSGEVVKADVPEASRVVARAQCICAVQVHATAPPPSTSLKGLRSIKMII